MSATPSPAGRSRLAASLETLNPEQRRAVEQTDGPVLILAGAGSGKTRVLTHKIAFLTERRGVPGRDILAMTFTKKAAEEMRTRIRELTGGEDGIWIGTFHSVFARILRTEAPLVGYHRDFVIYDKEDQERLVKQLIEKLGHSAKQVPPRMVASLISRSKNGLVSPQEFRSSNPGPMNAVTAEVFEEYQAALVANQAFDYDDLITVPIRLFREHPSVLEKYRRRFRYILVDEYQDTNRAQYRLVVDLSLGHRNLCVVGDDDQSIYGWRGADIRNILDFEQDFPETAVFRLEQNYRSTGNILKAAGSVVDKNLRRKAKTLWSAREAGEKVDVIEVEDEREEARRVVECIRDEVFRNKRNFRDFAVLYRTNAQSRAVEDGLRRAGISYVIVGGVRFYERKEIKDVLAYLKVITNPRDDLSLRRIVNFPIRGIGDTTLQKISAWAAERNLGLFESLGRVEEIPDIPGRAGKNMRAFHELIRKYAALKDEISAGELVHAVVDEIGLIAMFKDDTTPEGRGRIENLREFLNAAHEYTQTAEDATLSGFLEQIALITDIDRADLNSSAVTLMTVHCAKGLEFPVVAVVGLEDGLFPLIRDADGADDLEEERRLFYVALTRAKEKVILLHGRNRYVFNSRSGRIPSRFLDELDGSAVNVVREEPKRQVKRWSRFQDGDGNGYGYGTGESGFGRPRSPWDSDDFDDSPRPGAGRSGGRRPAHSPFQHGTRVGHEEYGRGTVLSVEGEGPRQTCLVRFDDGVEKKFLLRFARLERIQ
ncbi:MAG: UvrD-helicase domain-containing protein [bacterium]|nr:UvrD-helicase domain-containing protein [bacterium]